MGEVGPIPVPRAAEYLLRAQYQVTSSASWHTHPGNESMWVLAGQATVQTPTGDIVRTAGQALVGPPGGTPVNTVAGPGMEVFALFAIDASQPMTTPLPATAPAQVPQNLPRTGLGSAEPMAALVAGTTLIIAGLVVRRRLPGGPFRRLD